MMIKNRKRLEFSGLSVEKLQFFCLLLLGAADFLMVTVSPLRPWLAEFMAEQYLLIPALLFVGASLTVRQSPAAARSLLLGVVTVAWLAVAQCAQSLLLEEPESISLWWTPYLLAFPFAAVTDDGDSKKGLGLLGAVAVAASTVIAVFSAMLLWGVLPPFLGNGVFWDHEGRLEAMANPNITGWIFMIGIAFCLLFSFQAKNKWLRVGLLALAGAQLMLQGLTNSRTSSLMTCGLVGGVAFFAISRGGWKRFVVGLLAALILMGALFALEDAVYDWNYEIQAEKIAAEKAANKAVEEAIFETTAERSSPSEAEMEPTPLPSPFRVRNSFWQDLKTFTGRTGIWKAALKTLRDNPIFLLRGTTGIDDAITDGGFHAYVMHTHNSWLEMLVGFGIPALLLSLVFTFLAVRGVLVMLFSRRSSMLQKCVALLVGCMLVAGILEPFLFTGYFYCHFISVVFLLCTGYLDRWQAALRANT